MNHNTIIQNDSTIYPESKKDQDILELRELLKNKTNEILDGKIDVSHENSLSTRIYLLRHFPYKEDKNFKKYDALLKKKDGIGLSPKEHKLMIERSKKLEIKGFEELSIEEKEIFKSIFCNIEDGTTLIFDGSGDNIRAIKTGEAILNEYKDKNLKVVKYILPQSNKNDSLQDTRLKLSKSFIDMVSQIKNDNASNKTGSKNIIIIGNRSYADDFNKYVLGKLDTTSRESSDEFEGKGYLFADLDNNGKLLKDDFSCLVVTPENFVQLKAIFPDNNLDIYNFQIYINTLLSSHPEYFSEIISKNLGIKNLNSYCIYNLANINDFGAIRNYLYGCDSKDLEELKNIFGILYKKKNESSELWKTALFKLKFELFVKGMTYDFKQFHGLKSEEEDELDNDVSEILKIREATLSNINGIFENSLDKLINERTFVIERKKYFHEKLSPEEIKSLKIKKMHAGENKYISDEEMYKKTIFDFDDILNDPKNVTHVISANVGEGKSVELANFAYKFISDENNNKDYEVIFMSVKEMNESKGPDGKDMFTHYFLNMLNAVEKIDRYYQKKIILIIDGFDELPDIESENGDNLKRDLRIIIAGLPHSEWPEIFKSYIKSPIFGNNCIKIVGTREGEFNKQDCKITKVYSFEELSIFEKGNFIRERLKSLLDNPSLEYLDEKCIDVYVFLKDNHIDDTIGNSPLILYLVCELVAINKLGKIKNRAELYEEVTKGIIERHCKEKSIPLTKLDISNGFRNLGDMAYYRYLGLNKNKYLDNDSDNENNFEEERIYEQIKGLTELDYQKLNVIYMKNSDGVPIFIHNSFYEYFLARYLNENNLEDELFSRRDSQNNNWSSWKKFNPIVQFYGEILINSNKKSDQKRLENFLGLGSLLKNDDIFGENFLTGLDLLIKTIENPDLEARIIDMANLYLGIISGFDANKIICMLDGFIKLQEKNSHKNNIFFEKYIDVIIDKFFDQKENSEILSISNNNKSLFIKLKSDRLDKYIFLSLSEFCTLDEIVYSVYELNKLFSEILNNGNEQVYENTKKYIMSTYDSIEEIHSSFVLGYFMDKGDDDIIELVYNSLMNGNKEYDSIIGNILISGLLKNLNEKKLTLILNKFKNDERVIDEFIKYGALKNIYKVKFNHNKEIHDILLEIIRFKLERGGTDQYIFFDLVKSGLISFDEIEDLIKTEIQRDNTLNRLIAILIGSLIHIKKDGIEDIIKEYLKDLNSGKKKYLYNEGIANTRYNALLELNMFYYLHQKDICLNYISEEIKNLDFNDISINLFEFKDILSIGSPIIFSFIYKKLEELHNNGKSEEIWDYSYELTKLIDYDDSDSKMWKYNEHHSEKLRNLDSEEIKKSSNSTERLLKLLNIGSFEAYSELILRAKSLKEMGMYDKSLEICIAISKIEGSDISFDIKECIFECMKHISECGISINKINELKKIEMQIPDIISK